MHIHQLLRIAEAIGTPTDVGLPLSAPGGVLALLLALCAPFVLAIARRRVLAQPLAAHPEEEERILRAVLTEPSYYVYVHQLRGEHFVDEGLGGVWNLIAEHNREVDVPEVPRDERDAYALLEKVGARVPRDLREHLARRRNAEVLPVDVAERLDVLLAEAMGTSMVIGREELVAQASLVYNAGVDRHEYAGSARIERTGESRRPFRRIPSRPTPLRLLITTILLGAGGLVAGSVASHTAVSGGDTLVQAGIAAALVLLTIGSVIWTLVDLETMYVDMASFYAFAGASWAVTLAAASLKGAFVQALTGLLAVAGIVVFIEIVNQAYRRIRGRHGMGMGDYLLVLATIGVPVAITGSVMLGQIILIVSLLAGIVGWVFTRLTRPGFTRETPYAFGPYLACGWILGLLLWGVG